MVQLLYCQTVGELIPYYRYFHDSCSQDCPIYLNYFDHSDISSRLTDRISLQPPRYVRAELSSFMLNSTIHQWDSFTEPKHYSSDILSKFRWLKKYPLCLGNQDKTFRNLLVRKPDTVIRAQKRELKELGRSLKVPSIHLMPGSTISRISQFGNIAIHNIVLKQLF